MTREENVKNLLTELIEMIDNGSQRDLDRADEIAKTIIKALSQQPCDDLISREDAFEIIASNDATDGTEPIFTGRQVVALLSTLPSVTQKCEKCAMNGSGSKYCDNCGSKSGKWNKYYTSQKGNDVFNCKECGHTFVVTQGKDNMNFCPNCGCRMVEPQESEDKERIKAIPSAEPNMTWVTGADGAKIAFKDVPVWKVTKICEILGEPQESEDKQ